MSKHIVKRGREGIIQEDLDVDWRIILKMNLREIGSCDIDWIYLMQDRDMWRDFVITVMNLQVP
jgi:hypothetical protein